MKALSLRQPWAALVVYFGKSIENRKWNTHFRGDFLIHAAKGMTRAEFDQALAFARLAMGEQCPSEEKLRMQLQFGGVIGRAHLVTVIPPCIGEDGRANCPHPWHMPEQYGFILSDVRPLPFRACKGALSFFNLDLEAA